MSTSSRLGRAALFVTLSLTIGCGRDLCPDDPDKDQALVCGCGVSDDDVDQNGVPDCLDSGIDLCPDDPAKTLPGTCGCGVSDVDADHNVVPDCLDTCLVQDLWLCGGACVDTESDDANCGACGVTCGDGQSCNVGACSVPFGHTGVEQSFIVPVGVTTITVRAFGAQGGAGECCDPPNVDDGGLGGQAVGTVPVTPGETVWVYVGGQGVTAGAGGWNGGGAGGTYGAGGGGASDVRIGGQALEDRVLVAAGGGGGTCGCPEHGDGGDGGGLTGEAGTATDSFVGGGGGTATAGGSAGTSPGTAGDLGVGGTAPDTYHVAGGGGGYYGGGAAYAGGGGGGSSYLGVATDATTTTGVWTGDGLVLLSY